MPDHPADYVGYGLDLADDLMRRSLAWSAAHDRLDPEQSYADRLALARLDRVLWPPLP